MAASIRAAACSALRRAARVGLADGMASGLSSIQMSMAKPAALAASALAVLGPHRIRADRIWNSSPKAARIVCRLSVVS